jgi:TatD DNase family protein
MPFIDAHCHLDHLDLTPYSDGLEGVLKAAYEADIRYMLCAGLTLETFPGILALAHHYPEVFCAVGVQPEERDCREPTVEELITLAMDSHVLGIGETGLDYQASSGDIDLQRKRFRCHVQAACIAKKPLIIHCRMAGEEALRILQEEKAESVGGMFHCFTESWDIAKQVLDMDFNISISGIVTFKRADNVRAVAEKIPLNRLLIETDAPFLAPVPKRGKPNYPEYLKYTADYLARLRKISLKELGWQTTQNFMRLFNVALDL